MCDVGVVRHRHVLAALLSSQPLVFCAMHVHPAEPCKPPAIINSIRAAGQYAAFGANFARRPISDAHFSGRRPDET